MKMKRMFFCHPIGVMFGIAAIVAAVVVVMSQTPFVQRYRSDIPNDEAPATYYATVIKVSDGDTFTATIGDETVKARLTGVDTPESVSPDENRNVPFGKIAAKFTSGQLLGKQITLKTDVSGYDKYGRLLAYVYLPDGTFYNELLVREGYARVMTVPPNVAHAEDFLAAEKAAREEGLGIWQDYDNIFP
jgi:micrococcal nuclease